MGSYRNKTSQCQVSPLASYFVVNAYVILYLNFFLRNEDLQSTMDSILRENKIELNRSAMVFVGRDTRYEAFYRNLRENLN